MGARRRRAPTTSPAGSSTSTEASGIVTHNSYDCLGNQTQTYRTASGTSMKAGWRVTAYDAMGRALTVTTKLSDGNGTPTVQSVVTNVYDGSGQQLSSSDSTVGGEDEKWLYDEQGNVTKHWAMGVVAYDEARATRTAYDAEGQVTGESEPGNDTLPGLAGSAVTTYDLAGRTASEASPDGSSTAYSYDDEGNQTTAESTVTGTISSTYGADGRLATLTNERNFTTGSTYDGLGRVTGATGSGQDPTTTTYNHLGWVLRTTDANGVATSTVYDAHGAVIDETVGSAGTTHSSYDATTGRLEWTTDPNGNKVTNHYDLFGNLHEEEHEDWNAAAVKDVVTSFDSLGRPLSQSESVSGRSRTWIYPVNTEGGIEETLSYDAAPLTSTTVSRNPRGMETGRATTITSGVTLTRAVADTSADRDQADRWTAATLQLSGHSALTLGRTFDDAGRMATQSGAGFASAGSYSYEAASGLKSNQTLPLALGGAINDGYTYSVAGRLRTWGTDVYDFDDAGNLTADGTTTFTYDAANRLTSSLAGAQTTAYGWDEDNAWRTSQGPSSAPNQIQYTYTKSGASTSSGRMTGYLNQSAANITEVGSATASGSGTAVSITPALAISEGDLVLAVIHANATGTLITDANCSFVFTSDLQENGPDSNRYAIVHRRAAAGEPATYSWEAESSQNWSAEIRVFRGVDASVWDVAPSATTCAVGTSGTLATAPSMTTTSPGAVGLLICLTDAASTLTYSAPTNGYAAQVSQPQTMPQSSWTKTWGGAGATGTSSATLSASNDWLAHQVALKPAAGASATYAYDASGQRTRSTVSVGSTTTTTNFTYDGLTLLSLAATQGSDSWRIDYLYDEEGAVYGGVYRSPSTSASPTVFSVITNDHGDILELLDANGAAFAAYRYDPWGKPVGGDNYATGVWTQATSLVTSTLAGQIASRQVLRYASYAYDTESGLYYCSARYYDPATRQWTTGDPAKADGEESAYQYCGGEPIGAADSNGVYVIRQTWQATTANFTFTTGKNRVYLPSFEKYYSVTAQLRYHSDGAKWVIDDFAFFNEGHAKTVVSLNTYAVIQERMRDSGSVWTGRWSQRWGREAVGGFLFYNEETKQSDTTPYYVHGIKKASRKKYTTSDGRPHVGTRLYVKHQMQWGGFTSKPGWAGHWDVYLRFPQTTSGAIGKDVNWRYVSRFGNY